MQSRKTIPIEVFYMVAHLLKTVVISVNHLVKGAQNMLKNMEGDMSMPEDERWGYMAAVRAADPHNFRDFKYTLLTNKPDFLFGELVHMAERQQGVICIANTGKQMVAVANHLKNQLRNTRYAHIGGIQRQHCAHLKLRGSYICDRHYVCNVAQACVCHGRGRRSGQKGEHTALWQQARDVWRQDPSGNLLRHRHAVPKARGGHEDWTRTESLAEELHLHEHHGRVLRL